jgi:hypothetical protein
VEKAQKKAKQAAAAVENEKQARVARQHQPER